MSRQMMAPSFLDSSLCTFERHQFSRNIHQGSNDRLQKSIDVVVKITLLALPFCDAVDAEMRFGLLLCNLQVH